MFGFLFPHPHLSSGSVAKNSSYHLLVSPGCGCGVRTLPVCFVILKTALPDLNPAVGGMGVWACPWSSCACVGSRVCTSSV